MARLHVRHGNPRKTPTAASWRKRKDRPAERSPPSSGAGGMPRGRTVRSVRGSGCDSRARVAMGQGGVLVRTCGRRRGPRRRRGGTPGLGHGVGSRTAFRGVNEIPGFDRPDAARAGRGDANWFGRGRNTTAEKIVGKERRSAFFAGQESPGRPSMISPERPEWLRRQGQKGQRGRRSCRQPLMTYSLPNKYCEKAVSSRSRPQGGHLHETFFCRGVSAWATALPAGEAGHPSHDGPDDAGRCSRGTLSCAPVDRRGRLGC
jgi:hypothetical protein